MPAVVTPINAATGLPGVASITPGIINAPKAVKGIAIKNRRKNGGNGRSDKVTKGIIRGK